MLCERSISTPKLDAGAAASALPLKSTPRKFPATTLSSPTSQMSLWNPAICSPRISLDPSSATKPSNEPSPTTPTTGVPAKSGSVVASIVSGTPRLGSADPRTMVCGPAPAISNSITPGSALATPCSIAARSEQSPPPVSQTPSSRSASGRSVVVFTTCTSGTAAMTAAENSDVSKAPLTLPTPTAPRRVVVAVIASPMAPASPSVRTNDAEPEPSVVVSIVAMWTSPSPNPEGSAPLLR